MARRALSSTAPMSSESLGRGLLALDEFAHAGLEDAGQRAALVALAAGALVQGVQVAAGPEAAFEQFGLAARGADREHLAENIGPAGQRDATPAAAMISLTIRCALAIRAMKERSWAAFIGRLGFSLNGDESGGAHFGGDRVGQGARLRPARSTQPTLTRALASRASPQEACWTNWTEARPSF